MIILLGPDHSGKTHLAQQLSDKGLINFHAVAATDYKDYMDLLSGTPSKPIPLQSIPFAPGALLQKGDHFVLDRWFWCEGPYSQVFRGTTMKFSLKQFHNLHLATIAHNPVVILMNNRAPNYLPNEPVPAQLFTPLLKSYREWLTLLQVEYIEWNYQSPPMTLDRLIEHSLERQDNVIWWRNLAKKGIAGYGNTVNPRVLVVAEILGPSNVYHFPFEQGPSGYYLSELFDEASIPLGSFYLTNWKKTTDPAENQLLFEREVLRTSPRSVIFLGREAEKARPHVEALGYSADQLFTLKHPGWVVNHAESLKDVAFRKKGYLTEWTAVWRKALGEDSQESTQPTEESMVLTKVD